MNRRLFLKSSVAGLLLVACKGPLSAEEREFLCVDTVTALLASQPTAMSLLGERYRELYDEDVESMVAEVFEGGGDSTEAVQERIITDYATETIVDIDGWRIARTEARLAALVYLAERC